MSFNKVIKLASKFEYKIAQLNEEDGEKKLNTEIKESITLLKIYADRFFNSKNYSVNNYIFKNNINLITKFPPPNGVMPEKFVKEFKEISEICQEILNKNTINQYQIKDINKAWNRYPYKEYIGFIYGDNNGEDFNRVLKQLAINYLAAT